MRSNRDLASPSVVGWAVSKESLLVQLAVTDCNPSRIRGHVRHGRGAMSSPQFVWSGPFHASVKVRWSQAFQSI